MLSLQVTLATLLQHFEFELVESEQSGGALQPAAETVHGVAGYMDVTFDRLPMRVKTRALE